MISLQLIGPTGVGKTHWGERLAKHQGVEFQDLDAQLSSKGAESFLMEQGVLAFWQRSQIVLNDLRVSSKNYVVAIGAGTQWAACTLETEAQLISPSTCALWCEPVRLLYQLRTFRQDTRSLAQLVDMEYSQARSALYLRAQERIDRTHLSEQQVWAALIAVYQRLISH